MIKMEFEITKIGERGQVVIPQQFRKEMNIQTGDKFMVVHKENTIVLERLKPSEMSWEEVTKPLREAMKKTNLKESDVPEIIHRFRKKHGSHR